MMLKTSKEGFEISNQKIKVFAEKDPGNIPWGEVGADIVLECTGRFLDKTIRAKSHQGWAKKVIISAPAKEVDFTIVQGVNSKDLKKKITILFQMAHVQQIVCSSCYGFRKKFWY